MEGWARRISQNKYIVSQQIHLAPKLYTVDRLSEVNATEDYNSDINSNRLKN